MNHMNFLSNYGMFLLQTITLVLAILATVGGIIAISSKDKGGSRLKITELNKKFDAQKEQMLEQTLDKKALKEHQKQQKKAQKNTEIKKNKLFVIDFEGDIKASAVESLRHEITAILSIATPNDEVLVNIESGGGTVNAYGFAASQLQRIVSQGIPLTASVDKVAASGGYLMASVANKILAAPFAIVGSIGVVAQMPNFHRWLKKHDIDFELLTAGEYKRTLTVFGENTPQAKEKFTEEMDTVHHHFKDHIAEHRKQVIIEKVATGEHWLAKEAFELNLVDKLITSDEYISVKAQDCQILKIESKRKMGLAARLLKPAATILNNS